MGAPHGKLAAALASKRKTPPPTNGGSALGDGFVAGLDGPSPTGGSSAAQGFESHGMVHGFEMSSAEIGAAAQAAAKDAKDLRRRNLRKWNAAEDAALTQLVQEQLQGVTGRVANWGAIGAQLDGRTGKQCRERWHNQLDPAIRKDPWTEEEEQLLVKVPPPPPPRTHACHAHATRMHAHTRTHARTHARTWFHIVMHSYILYIHSLAHSI